jgi:hypothetical protein
LGDSGEFSSGSFGGSGLVCRGFDYVLWAILERLEILIMGFSIIGALDFMIWGFYLGYFRGVVLEDFDGGRGSGGWRLKSGVSRCSSSFRKASRPFFGAIQLPQDVRGKSFWGDLFWDLFVVFFGGIVGFLTGEPPFLFMVGGMKLGGSIHRILYEVG